MTTQCKRSRYSTVKPQVYVPDAFFGLDDSRLSGKHLQRKGKWNNGLCFCDRFYCPFFGPCHQFSNTFLPSLAYSNNQLEPSFPPTQKALKAQNWGVSDRLRNAALEGPARNSWVGFNVLPLHFCKRLAPCRYTTFPVYTVLLLPCLNFLSRTRCFWRQETMQYLPVTVAFSSPPPHTDLSSLRRGKSVDLLQFGRLGFLLMCVKT